jgi:acyl carrier protein
MTEQEILAVLTTIFQDVFDNPEIVIARTTSGADIPDWDSFNNINIILGIEMKLGVRFSTGDVEKMSNVGDLIGAISAKLK